MIALRAPSFFRSLSQQKYFIFFLGFLRKYRLVVLTVLFLNMLADILFFVDASDIRVYGLTALYIVAIFLYRLKSTATFRLALVLTGVMFLEFVFTRTSERIERAAIWLFFFLMIGIIQQFRE